LADHPGTSFDDCLHLAVSMRSFGSYELRDMQKRAGK
jgi:hypothetical protein